MSVMSGLYKRERDDASASGRMVRSDLRLRAGVSAVDEDDMNLTQCIRGGSENNHSGFIICFHYDEQVIETLKRNVPHTEREWREDKREWWVSERYEGVLRHLFTNFEAMIYLQGRLW